MPPFRTIMTMSPAAPTWPALWSDANQARDSGRPEKAFDLYATALAASPTSPQPYLDAGCHALHINRSFRSVDELYNRHAADFGGPESLGHGGFEHLSGSRYGWSFALLALQRACELEPAKAEWQMLLAQVHEHLGQTEQALSILRRINDGKDATPSDARRYGALLERTDPAKAASHYQDSVRRWPSAGDLSWRLLVAQIDCHAEVDAQATYSALLKTLPSSGRASNLQIHRLALMAWAMYLQPVPAMTQRVLADFAPVFALASQHYPMSPAAQLATGFGALLQGRMRAAKQALALGSLVASGHSSDLNDVLPDLTEAHETALQSLLQIDGISPFATLPADDLPLPKDTQEHISAMQAGALLQHGEVFDALRQFGDSIAPHLVRKPYTSSETILGHRIVFHQGKFYALPRMVGNFAFVGGMVYRIPEKVRIMRPTVPRLFVRIAKPIAKRIIVFISRYRSLRYIGRYALRVALSRYAIRGVVIDSDFDAVVIKLHERANMFPNLFAASFGTVDASTSNVLPRPRP